MGFDSVPSRSSRGIRRCYHCSATDNYIESSRGGVVGGLGGKETDSVQRREVAFFRIDKGISMTFTKVFNVINRENIWCIPDKNQVCSSCSKIVDYSSAYSRCSALEPRALAFHLYGGGRKSGRAIIIATFPSITLISISVSVEVYLQVATIRTHGTTLRTSNRYDTKSIFMLEIMVMLWYPLSLALGRLGQVQKPRAQSRSLIFAVCVAICFGRSVVLLRERKEGEERKESNELT